MGGRGGLSGGFYRETRNRRTWLQNVVSELDAKIGAIDAEAERVYQAKYEEELSRLQTDQWSAKNYTASQMAELAADAAVGEKALFLEETDRAELARERYKRRRELNAIKAGQRTLL